MRYITLDDLFDYNECVCDEAGEESIIINENNLLSALSVQDSYFETDEEIISALFRSIIIGHGFQDGNKRTAVLCLLDAVPNRNSIILTDDELGGITIQIANGDLADPTDIAKLLFGVDFMKKYIKGYEEYDDRVDAEIINPEDRDYYDTLYEVNLYNGLGYYGVSTFRVYARYEQDALEKAVAYCEQQKRFDILTDVDEVSEDEEDMYIYVDATMDGASKPYYILQENLRIVEVPEIEPKYTVNGYLDSKYYSLMESEKSDDFNFICDKTHEFCSSGLYTEVINNISGNSVSFDPDYWEEETAEGEYPRELIALGMGG